MDWRQPLRDGLASVAPERQRQLRALQPGPCAGQLQANGAPETLLDLASNDYLGLSQHPTVLAAAASELQTSGLGAGASRLVSGSRPVHDALERELAGWLGRERALLFPSGFQANLAAVAALADRHTLVLADRLIHHSLLTGVTACGARLKRFPHNDLSALDQRLLAARHAQPHGRLLVISESLFSMEGTSPDLPTLEAICAHHGAALLLDEAHALGVLGRGGRGLAWRDHGGGGRQGDGPGGHPARWPNISAPALISGTFGKAFGSGGAFLAGDALVIEWLLQHSGPFRYTTAMAPPLAAGALAALRWLQERERSGEEPGLALLQRARRWRDGLESAGWPRPPGEGPILPLLVGDDRRTLDLQQRLEAAGLLSVAIRPPTVPEGHARLRLVLHHDLPAGTLGRVLQALGTPG